MKNYIYWLSLLLVVAVACKEDIIAPLSDDGIAPGPVTNTRVENLPGAAKISYTLPKDANLLYVKAVFELNGVSHEERASYFNNNITVQGFGDTQERTVELSTVSRSERASEPVTVTVRPLSPPIEDIFKSLNVIEAFGGINVSYKNVNKGKVVIEVLLQDSTGEWLPLSNEYTEIEAGNFSVRGMPPIQRTFGIFVRDRWNNRSDTMVKKLTPIYEELLAAPTYKRNSWPIPQRPPLPVSGPMVTPSNLSSWPFDELFNDVISSGDGFHTNEKQPQPIWIPFDLGAKTKLSRFKIWQRQAGYIFNHGNPHRWELWGTNTPTDTSSWVLLGAYLMTKPSGGDSPGAESQQDNDVAVAGQEYDFLPTAPAVRYVAWKNIDSWANIGGETGFFHLTEMKLYGQKQ